MSLRPLLIPVGACLCLFPSISGGVALLMGMMLTMIFGNPYLTLTKTLPSKLLSLSIVGLGAGMNFLVVAETGLRGLGYTAAGIALTLGAGLTLGHLLGVNKTLSALIATGTAICGGSAIAAISPVVKARHEDTTIALAVVFLLNAAALFLFPPVGHAIGLTEEQFGLWSALAIHDTSSVVGTTLAYGKEALQVGTTVKLTRALWIIPLVLAFSFFFSRTPPNSAASPPRKYPWFILGFLAMAAAATWIPAAGELWSAIQFLAKRLFVLTLFFIGSNITWQVLKQAGTKSLILGLILWVVAAAGSVLAITSGVIAL